MRAALLALSFAGAVLATEHTSIAQFSTMAAGEVKPPWREVALSNIKPVRFDLVAEEGATVLRARAEAAAGSVAQALNAAPNAFLIWRWKVDRVVEHADMTRKAGDDFAARVYVFFDVPLDALSFADRMRIWVARAIYGREVPTAAICYVWDNSHAVGTTMPNSYTDRVRMVVLESGAARVGTWVVERRDVESDYRLAFAPPADAQVPRVSGIAASADTDQTGENVTAWFGDFRLEPRP